MRSGDKHFDEHCLPTTVHGEMGSILNRSRVDTFLVYLQCWKVCEAHGLPLTEDILMRGRGLGSAGKVSRGPPSRGPGWQPPEACPSPADKHRTTPRRRWGERGLGEEQPHRVRFYLFGAVLGLPMTTQPYQATEERKHLTTGGPGKEQGTNKLPATRILQTLGPPLENNPEIPPSSRDEGLRLLHGLETNLAASLQTPQEA